MLRRIPIWFLCLGLVACAPTSAGSPSAGLPTPILAQSYQGLESGSLIFGRRHGAAVVIAPGLAVTNAHNANLLDDGQILGTSTTYDLLFFRTDRAVGSKIAQPRLGQRVVAYGQGFKAELREASGRVLALDAPVAPRCAACALQKAFTFDASAGKGFSGGPVVDPGSGAVVGITFGFRDQEGMRGRLMYAYPMDLVLSEAERIIGLGLTARSGS